MEAGESLSLPALPSRLNEFVVITPIAGPSQPRELRAQTTEISIVTLPEDARAQIRQVVDEQVRRIRSLALSRNVLILCAGPTSLVHGCAASARTRRKR